MKSERARQYRQPQSRSSTRAMITGMEPLHISEADAVRDLAAILQRVQAGAEVVIERDAQPLAIIRAAALRPAARSPNASPWPRPMRRKVGKRRCSIRIS